MEIDLHGYKLVEAKLEMQDIFQECYDADEKEINIIHGWKQGQVLRNYFRSNRFLSEMKKQGILIVERRYISEGETQLLFKFLPNYY